MQASALPFLSLCLLCLTLISCERTEQKDHSGQSSPTSFPYEEIQISELRTGYQNGDFTVEEVVQAYLDRIETIDRNGPQLNSILQVNPEALDIARTLDALLQSGRTLGPLHGIPVILKDNIDTHDQMYTTAGSRALAESRPLQDSYIATQLRKAGAVILGKANLSEWANFRGELSSSGWSGILGQTHNPYVLDRNPCGSSSGSGVAVSANLCMVAIGTETNGSIVCPSSNNGVVGIKPTVGLLSRSGIIPISFTQDTPGPMARTVTDAAICLGAMTGVDPTDSLTLASEVRAHKDYTQFLNSDGLAGKRIGWFTGPRGNHYKVDQLMQETVDFLKSQGVKVVEIESICAEGAGGWSFNVMLYEYKDGLNRYFASLGSEAPIKSLEELIAFNAQDSVEMRYYNQRYLEMAQAKGELTDPKYREARASMLRACRQEGIDRVLAEHNLDAIMAPTGAPAWKTDLVNGDHYMFGSSSPAAQAGYPNISLPMGFIGELPVGISFFGTAWSEPQLIEIAYAFEQATQVRRAPRFLPGSAE